MKSGRTVARNALWLTAQALFTGAIAIVVTAIVARYLGTERYGTLLLLLSYTGIFLPINALGLRPYSVREIASDKSHAIQIVSDMLALRLALAVVGTAIAATIFSVTEAHQSRMLVMALVGILLINAVAQCIIDGLYGVENFRSAALTMVASATVVQVALVGAVLLDLGLNGIVVSYVLGAMTTLVVGWFFFRKHVGAPRIGHVRREHFEHVRKSGAFFLQGVVNTVAQPLSLITVSGIGGAHVAGVYGAQQNLVNRSEMLHDGMTTALFPRVSDLHGKSSDELGRLVRGAFKIAMVMALPMAVGLWFTAHEVVDLVFGHRYAEGGIVLAVLALGLPFRFAYAVLLNVLTAMRRQAIVLACSSVATVTTIGLVAFGVWRHGALGAAIGLTLGMAVHVLPLAVVYWRQMGSFLSLRDTLGLLVANIAMGVLLWFIRDWPLWFEIPVAAAFYAVAVRVLGIVTIAHFKAVLGRRSAE